MAGFASGIKRSGDRYKRKATRVYSQSVIDLFEFIQRPWHMGGFMPFLTGALQNSLTIYLKSSTAAVGAYAFRSVLQPITLETVVTGIWNIHYAWYQEHGFNGHPGRHFVALGVQKWPSIVEANIQKYRNMT